MEGVLDGMEEGEGREEGRNMWGGMGCERSMILQNHHFLHWMYKLMVYIVVVVVVDIVVDIVDKNEG